MGFHQSIAVVIVEDNLKVLRALEAIVDGTVGMTCVGAYGCAEDLLASELARVDVVLLDLELPGMQGAEAIEPLRRRWKNVSTVILTVHQEEDVVFDALCAGAVGYILKTTPPAEIVAAIQDVHNGGAPMTPSIARRVLGFMHRRRSTDEELSPREREVLDRLTAGKSNRQIADELFISPNTVGFHIKKIYHKLHVHSRAEAVARVLRDRRP